MENNNSIDSNQQPLVSQSSPHYSKTFITLIVVILIAAVGVGGYFLGVNQKQATQNLPQPIVPITQSSPIPTVDPTTDWKTYTNKEYAFSIKYPSSVLIKEYPQKDEGAAPVISMEFNDIDAYTLLSLYISNTYPTRENPKEIIDVLVFQDNLDKTRKIIHTRSSYSVDDIQGEELMSDIEDSTSKYGNAVVIVVKNKKEYQFGIRYNPEDKDTALQIFEQVLSTFKFTN